MHAAQPSIKALRSVDLNLLVVLEALLDARSVAAAAQRLGISPSATSHALSRLRVALHDPLLVRAGRGMVPTPRAQALQETLRDHLAGLGSLLMGRGPFEPETSTRQFRISSSDYFSTVLLPTLLAQIHAAAPSVRIEVVDRDLSPATSLERADFDLHVGLASKVLASGLKRQRLFADEMVCVVRRDHPAFVSGQRAARRRPRLSLSLYAELDHVMVGIGRPGPTGVDTELAAQGLERKVVCRVAHFVAALATVAKTDMVLTIPRRLATQFGDGLGLVSHRSPLSPMEFKYTQFWHSANHADPGHRWFRAQVRAAGRSLG